TRFAAQIGLSQGRGELSMPFQLDLISSGFSFPQTRHAPQIRNNGVEPRRPAADLSLGLLRSGLKLP
ncbi:hypothetical protein, partial [Bradyrhizobium sp.]|uniref:hypothetical protein n=1 Tax=Bradyrhizobium sp. TaxID=376 RepID=UPI0025BB0884